MSEARRKPSPARARRTHAERTRETRRRVKAAVVEAIAEVGYQRTTAAEIARRADVSWGAVQHHFGDKDGILVAVLEESFERFTERFAAAPAPGLALEARVDEFVERAWAHFESPHYRTALEILLNLPDDIEAGWQADMLGEWNAIWRAYFSGFPGGDLGSRRVVELMIYVVSVLSGLATTRTLAGAAAPIRARELAFLKETLVRHLQES